MISIVGGHTGGMSSEAGVHRWPLVSAYSVSKAAAAKLTENLAHETRRHGISVFSVHPGLLPVGMVEVTRAFHRERGVPDDISWATLADLGQQLVIHRKRRGTTGLDLQWWLVAHFLGTLYALGRLQFHLYHLRVGIAGPAFWPDTDEPGFRKGDATLGVHIPATGPLGPADCDVSFALARSFVRERFSEHDFGVATCTSWLLDEHLADYLPDDSNIVRFQRRFTVVDGATDDGRDTLRFVFDRVPESINDLPQRTTLERAIVTHLHRGGRWRTRTGWLVP